MMRIYSTKSASMRPQCFHCGKAVPIAPTRTLAARFNEAAVFPLRKDASTMAEAVQEAVASMRPQCFHCGKHGAREGAPARDGLQ